MKKHDACLIQIACGDQTRLMELTMRRHAEYCAKWGWDYRLTIGPQTSQACFIEQWFEAIGEALKQKYKYVVFLDSDTCIVGDVDLREGCPPDYFNATWHDNPNWGHPLLYDHFNLGCLYIGNGPRTRQFFDWWKEQDFTGHPWAQQHIFNQACRDRSYICKEIGHRWNSTPWHNEPGHPPIVMAWHGYGNMEQRYERMKADLEAGTQAEPEQDEHLSLDDAYVRAHRLQLTGDTETAERLYKTIVEAEPRHSTAMRQLGIMLCEKGRHEEALQWCERSLAFAPTDAATLTCLGALHTFAGRYEEAAYYCNRSLAIAPDQPSAHYNRSNGLLTRGEWPQAWDDYEWGRMCNVRITRFPTPMLRDQKDLTGKTLCIWEEQGQGDTIICLQLIAEVRRRLNPAKVVLECRQELLPLLMPYLKPGLVDQFVSTPDDRSQPVPFDEHIATMSLPALLRLKVEDLPLDVNYIQAPKPEVIAGVGFCWRGSPVHSNDKRRSIDAETLKAWKPGAIFENFCPGHEPPEYVRGACGLNWKQTAERLAGLELLVTVDTAVAHLAGAMGVPCWVLLPKLADFRWMIDRPDSPFYPSVRLFRQEVADDWAHVLERVGEELKAWRQTAS